MTSIPASRNARAMIFAPRSCPSSPGFATTTRKGCPISDLILSASLVDDRPAIDTVDLAQHVAHLSNGGLRFDRANDRRHHVVADGGGLLDVFEGTRRLGLCARTPHALRPLDLPFDEARVELE